MFYKKKLTISLTILLVLLMLFEFSACSSPIDREEIANETEQPGDSDAGKPGGGGSGCGGLPGGGNPQIPVKNISINITVPPTGFLTPIYSSSIDERSTTLSITIPELDASETVNVGLAANSYGLSLTGSTSVGTGVVNLNLSYDGVTQITQVTSVSVGIIVSTAGYNLTGSPSISISIIDGRSSDTSPDRRIPVNHTNVIAFNEFANTLIGSSRHYKLVEDIALPGVAVGDSNWTAIGNGSGSFTGSFDGQNFTISNLIINKPGEDEQGMFGYIANGSVVKNVGLVEGSVSGNDKVGGVVGSNYWNSVVENSYTTGNVSGTNGLVGGVVGWNVESLVKNCYSTGNVSGIYWVGGVVGDNRSTVQNCHATGNVNGYQAIGGVVGSNFDGGLVENCYAMGDVSGTDGPVGGVVGDNNVDGTVQNCYAIGDVIGYAFIGGVVGINYWNGPVQNCYATGKVSGTYDVGGVVGQNNGVVQNCVAGSKEIIRVSVSVNAMNFGHVAGFNDVTATLINNLARADMVINPTDIYTGEDGTSVPLGTSLLTVFSGWGAPWTIPSGNLVANDQLPTLQGMSGVAQNPILP